MPGARRAQPKPGVGAAAVRGAELRDGEMQEMRGCWRCGACGGYGRCGGVGSHCLPAWKQEGVLHWHGSCDGVQWRCQVVGTLSATVKPMPLLGSLWRKTT